MSSVVSEDIDVQWLVHPSRGFKHCQRVHHLAITTLYYQSWPTFFELLSLAATGLRTS